MNTSSNGQESISHNINTMENQIGEMPSLKWFQTSVQNGDHLPLLLEMLSALMIFLILLYMQIIYSFPFVITLIPIIIYSCITILRTIFLYAEAKPPQTSIIIQSIINWSTALAYLVNTNFYSLDFNYYYILYSRP